MSVLSPEIYAKCLEIQIQALQDQLQLIRESHPDAVGTTAEKKAKKKKADVDPNKPKRSASAYQLFISNILPKLKLANPTLAQKELMTLAARSWSQIDDETKKEFTEAAARDKVEYTKKLTIYNESHDHPNASSEVDSSVVEHSESESNHAVEAPTTTTTSVTESTESHKKKKKNKKRKSEVHEAESQDESQKKSKNK
mmetsp:Transcript_23413/g.24056  ORF Transcript_23413/g.24056 Transcript_23413/m.24056 type:complete len:198 (+) Transcript_23413:64-657(+)|eukprot:CAMPEP_0174821560 /NCGR_PEP_ID=MMETSP1107-20130205/9067_1 /TAXON_ID=36770 /ORGANISM="Paraphysomonas vestita, Strain GFlagA" /LENGTH=197 /DNA_ID=CAMNT_0016038741 /DNA_START=41 /DNA_END=637 /DNA_ORIENTATION=-